MTNELEHRDVEQVGNRLGLPDGTWKKDWPASEVSWVENPPSRYQEILEQALIQLRIGNDLLPVFRESFAELADNPALQRFLWHCRHILIEREKYDFTEFMALPAPASGGEMFHALVFLSAVPVIRDFHIRHGIPEEVSSDTLSDLELWIRTHRQWYGYWGFRERQWLFHHFRGNLYKLGRLQFLIERFPDDLHLLRHRQTADLMLLAPDKALYRRDGQFDGTNRLREDQPFTSHYLQTEQAYNGIYIAPQGCITGEKVQLLKSQWQQVLKKEDAALSFHIPATGPMNPDDCRQSFIRAVEFFPRYFPDIPYKAFFSHSWLYDHQLNSYLPEDSNILRFQRFFYLYPLPGTNDKQIFERVFGPTFTGVQSVNPQTSLQRAVIEHVQKGGHWRTSGALLLPDAPALRRNREQFAK